MAGAQQPLLPPAVGGASLLRSVGGGSVALQGKPGCGQQWEMEHLGGAGDPGLRPATICPQSSSQEQHGHLTLAGKKGITPFFLVEKQSDQLVCIGARQGVRKRSMES